MNQKPLTRLGRLRRQWKFVRGALARYPIDVTRISLVSAHTNFVYRVRDASGRLYALRLVMPGWRTEQNLDAEVAWLGSLANDTDIPVPGIIESLEGERYIRFHDQRLDIQRRGVLMTWLPGMHLGKRLNPGNVRKMGELFARLHVHARGWSLPPDFPHVAFTGFLGRNEPDLLFDDRHTRQLPPQILDTLEAARRCVDHAYQAKSETDLNVIHCDLHHDNIKICKGALAPIDFEDTVLGYREHDIAMGLLDLADEVSNEAYERYLESFVDGYEGVTSYPQADILPFQLGRILWQLNWVARFNPGRLAQAARSRSAILKRALRFGKLQIH